jgi:hypothetical protein
MSIRGPCHGGTTVSLRHKFHGRARDPRYNSRVLRVPNGGSKPVVAWLEARSEKEERKKEEEEDVYFSLGSS